LTTPQGYTCAAVTDVEEILALRDEWTDLLLHSQVPNVFLSWEWMTTWIRTHGQGVEPYVLLLRRADDGLLTGLAPLYRRVPRYPLGLRTVGLMGSGVGADHLGFIARATMEKEVHAALAGQLLAAGGWDVLDLPRLEETFAGQLMAVLKGPRAGLTCTSSLVDLCPFIRLPRTWEEYSRVMHQRAELGRRWRRLQEKGEVRIQRVETVEELEEGWAALTSLHRGRRQAVGGRSALLAPQAMAFHQRFIRAAFDRGWLRLYLLRVDGQAVAAEYCLQVGKRLFDFNGGFDMDWARYWVRSILTAHAIRMAIEEGDTEYDLSRGAESYKLERWGAETRPDFSLVAWKQHARMNLTMAARGWVRAARDRARRFGVRSISWRGSALGNAGRRPAGVAEGRAAGSQE
jgi:CelD/BcsL family acetyltransferase involved in cellulose biosynthesis